MWVCHMPSNVEKLQQLESTKVRDFLQTLTPDERFKVITETQKQLSVAIADGATPMQIECAYEFRKLLKEFAN